MNAHIKKQIPAFLDRELPQEEQKRVGEHIITCRECRDDHDSVKLGRDLAMRLHQSTAPESVWKVIASEIAGEGRPVAKNGSAASFWKFAAAFSAFLVLIGISAVSWIYLNDRPAATSEVATVGSSNGETRGRPAWKVENISGDPKITNAADGGSLSVGGILETDSNSTAKIRVADIGEVEVSPNSIVRLLNTSDKEHRLALERGKLHAQINAPPRLFVVDTPAAAAVDLGCEYTLEVGDDGRSRIHVTSGYVALEGAGAESFVPAGAVSEARRGFGPGIPFFTTASDRFRNALEEFDFQKGGGASVDVLLEEAKPADTLSLWHLIARVPLEKRSQVLRKITGFMILSDGLTEVGILHLDKNMMLKLRDDLEILWYP